MPLGWRDDNGKHVNDANDPQVFFYQDGKKVLLRDTGMSVVKMKAGVKSDELPTRPVSLSPESNLSSLHDTLAKRDLVIVNTSGPHALDVHNAPDAIKKLIEYTLPICELSNGAPQRGATVVMTKDIVARFSPEFKEGDVSEYLKAVGLKIVRKQKYEPNAYVLELADGPVTYSRLLTAANKLYEKGAEGKRVVYSFPDFIVPTKRQQAPSNVDFAKLWHLNNTGQSGGKPGADVKGSGCLANDSGRPNDQDRDHR